MIWKSQTIFSNLSSMKVFEFQLQFHWSLFPRVQLIISQHWFRQWLGTELPVGAKPLPIFTPVYWHPPQSNFTEHKQDMVAVFYAPVNGQWVNQQALYFLGLSEFTHVCQVPCMTGQLGQLSLAFVSLTFRELSKIFSWNLCIAEIVVLMRISSWNFVRVPKAWLWAHVQSFSLKFSP